MRTAIKVVAAMMAVYLAFFVTAIWHGGLLGPLLARAQEQRQMGPTIKLAPGQTFTLDDGRKVTLESGAVTSGPSGFVFYTPEGKSTYWECASDFKRSDGNCRDGEILHYWNPNTGETQDVLLKHGKFIVLPAPAEPVGD